MSDYWKDQERRAQEYARWQAEGMRNLGMYANSGLAATMTEEQKKRRQAKLDETRQLQGDFLEYLTEIDCTSPCETLPPDYQAHLDRPDWWTYIDQDQDFDKGDDSPPF